MFPLPSPFGMEFEFTESCIFMFRNMVVFMMNVVVGPHTSAYPAGGGGALLYVSDGSSFVGVNVSFTGGRANHWGGGVTLNQGHLACLNCTFANNTAAGSDPFGGPHGGAIFNHNIYGSVTLENPTFIGNSPSVEDDCSCAGYCKQRGDGANCSQYCANAEGGSMKCCVCSGVGCPTCCVAPGHEPISGADDHIPCRGMPPTLTGQQHISPVKT
jgi:hypothetical protein